MGNEVKFVMAMSGLIISVILLMYAETILVLKADIVSKKKWNIRFLCIILSVIAFCVFWLCNNHRFNFYNSINYR